MLVHPAPGLIVIRPDTNAPLSANGADVPDQGWCLRRLRDGDVLPGLLGAAPGPTPSPTPAPGTTPPPVPTPNPTPAAAGIATTTTAGLVKGGGNVTIASDGTMNAPVSGITIGTAAGTAAAGNDTRIVGAAQASSLATVATSGKYSDLTGLPAIPTTPSAATSSAAGLVKPGTGLAVTADGTLSTTSTSGTAYTLTAATASAIGGVKPGAGLTVAADGTLSTTGAGGTTYTLPAASTTALGGIKIGANLTVTADGTLSGPAPSGASYTLPPATASVLGGLKIGTGLTTTADGTVSVPSTATPLSNAIPRPASGSGGPGTGTAAARDDHYHPAAGPALLPLDHTYTASGDIDPAYRFVAVSSPDRLAMKLANGTVNGQRMDIKRLPGGGFDLTLNVDGTAGGVISTGNTATLPLDVINLVWAAAPVASWLVIA